MFVLEVESNKERVCSLFRWLLQRRFEEQTLAMFAMRVSAKVVSGIGCEDILE
jgi:hypothetical protein